MPQETSSCFSFKKNLQFKLQGEKDWQKYETARKLKVNSGYCAVYLLLFTIENLIAQFLAIISIHPCIHVITNTTSVVEK